MWQMFYFLCNQDHLANFTAGKLNVRRPEGHGKPFIPRQFLGPANQLCAFNLETAALMVHMHCNRPTHTVPGHASRVF
jgi:hypothetical protein